LLPSTTRLLRHADWARRPHLRRHDHAPIRWLLGGFTAFSSFSLQTLNLANDGEWLQAGGNIVASVVFCLFAVWLGHLLAVSINAMKWI
jgi:fluoride ion exporter CrcB/FEX